MQEEMKNEYQPGHNKINRFHPWDGAERKLLDANVTHRAGEARAGRAPIVSEPTQSTNTNDKNRQQPQDNHT